MTKPLLAIISSPKDNALVARHWPYLKVPGWPIAGCGTVDGKCEWPEPVMRLDTGAIGLKHVGFGTAIYGLLQQELDVIEAFLRTDHTHLCVVEADNVFVRKPPVLPNGLYLAPLVPNYSPKLFNTPVYFTTPRCMDRLIGSHVVHHGNIMMKMGDVQHWMSDRWFPHICHKGKIPFQHFPGFTQMPYCWMAASQNESFIRDARAAIQLGCCSIHGIKDPDTLEKITAGFNILPNGL